MHRKIVKVQSVLPVILETFIVNTIIEKSITKNKDTNRDNIMPG